MKTITLLRQMIQIPSVFPHEQQMAEFLEKLLIDRGFKVNRQYVSRGRFNLLAKKGNSAESILLYGHMDTVPEYGKWTKGPWNPWRDGDRLYGRGSVDMKGGIATMINALSDIEPRKYSIKIALGVDEENNSLGATKLAESGFMDDVVMVYVPESDLIEKNYTHQIRWTLGRRGRAAYEIEIEGRSSHGAISNDGISAIEGASRLVLELVNLPQVRHQKLGRSSSFVRNFYSQAGSLSVSESATLMLDWHLVPPQTTEINLTVLNNFLIKWNRKYRGLVATARIQERNTPYLESYIMPRHERWNRRLGEIIKVEVGEEIRPFYGKSVADENIFGQKLPVVVLGPVGGNIHAGDEWVSIKSLIELEKILRNYFGELFD